MIFKVENLGVIAKAEVDLSKDLILLTGQNNTGKTYLAYAIYSFFELMNETYIYFSNRLTGNNKYKTFAEELIKQKHILREWKYDRENVKKVERLISNALKIGIKDIFNSSDQSLFDQVKFLFLFKENILEQLISKVQYGRTISSEENRVIAKKEKNSLQLDIELIINEDNISQKTIDFINFAVNDSFLDVMIYAITIPKQTYIFTAERSAINIFSNELSSFSEQISEEDILKSDKKDISRLIQKITYRYSQPIRDSLAVSKNLQQYPEFTSEFIYLAEELEQTILGGKVQINKNDDLQYKPKKMDQSLEIHLTSSLVKSLSPLAFYLRHLAQKNDCIIIDEPELNLHPDNQILIARFLGRLVNEGFKVVISTHSDYIIKEINNMVMLSKEGKARDKLLKKYNYSATQTIKPEQIEALLFKLPKNGGQITTEKIEVSNTGLSIATIDEVIDQLENRAENIYYQLFEKDQN